MSTVIKLLLIALVLYFIYTWFKSLFTPPRVKNRGNQSNVRIFKQGDVEKPSVQIKDAKTVESEEIEKRSSNI
ncbi:MAG: hypothetical protein ACR2MS_07005 [Weeksellaceae bacterium]